MTEEFPAIQKNHTWDLVQRPMDETKIIGLKWIYRSKLNPDGSLNKHKARLVVKGYYQEYGIDYSETFAPVAKLETVRMLIALAAQNQWKINQMDVKSLSNYTGLIERVLDRPTVKKVMADEGITLD